MVKGTLEALPEVKMEEHLGYARHVTEGRAAVTRATASAARPCAAALAKSKWRPCGDRNSSFQPKIAANSLGNFAEAVVSLYAGGMSTREIEQHMRESIT